MESGIDYGSPSDQFVILSHVVLTHGDLILLRWQSKAQLNLLSHCIIGSLNDVTVK
jgi:hypothetical protein